MKNSEKKQLEKLQKEINKLPIKAQQTICWLIDNFDFVQEICKDSEMSDEEIKKQEEIAGKKQDYMALALLCAVKIYKNEDSDRRRQAEGGHG